MQQNPNKGKRPRDEGPNNNTNTTDRRRPGKTAKGSEPPLEMQPADLSRRDAKIVSLWREDKMCDIEIRVGGGAGGSSNTSSGRTFSAHRVVLASSSEYMSSLLSADRFADSTEPTIELGGIGPASFEVLLEWMYTGACQVEVDEMSDVLAAASYLQCEEFISRLVPVVLGRFDVALLSSAWEMAEREILPALAAGIEKKMLCFFEAVRTSPDFHCLSSALLAKLMSSDDLIVKSEDILAQSLLRWVQGQEGQVPNDEINALIMLLRFDFLSSESLKEIWFITSSTKSLEEAARDSSSTPRNYHLTDYMPKTNDINKNMRAVLLDWLAEVTKKSKKIKLTPQALFLCASIIDRYLSLVPDTPRKILQLVGGSALLIAIDSKLGRNVLTSDTISYLSDGAFTAAEVEDMTQKIKSQLENKIVVPTLYTFLEESAKMINAPELVKKVALHYLEKMLIVYETILLDPLHVAVTCLSLAVNNSDVRRMEGLSAVGVVSVH